MGVNFLGAVSWFAEGFWLTLGLLLVNFCFLLDEPLFDFSDWSVLHILCLFLGFVSVFSDNRVRAYLGQWVPKDLTVMQGALVYWLTLERYAVAVVSVSGLHFLVPLEAELFDLVEVHSFLFNWVSTSIFFVWLLALFSLFLGYAINLSLG
jgi:hypothetical protein